MPEPQALVPPNEELLKQNRESFSSAADGSILLRAVLDMKEAQGETRAKIEELRNLVNSVKDSTAENSKKLSEIEGLVRTLDKKFYAAAILIGVLATILSLAGGQILSNLFR